MRRNLLLAGSLLLLAGCDQNGGANVTVRDKDGTVTVSANGQHITVRGNDGSDANVTISGHGQQFSVKSDDGRSVVEINGSGVNVSGKLPAYIGVYPGAKVSSSMVGGDASGVGGTLIMDTNAQPADIIKFYKQKTDAAGFKQTLSMDQGGTLVYSAAAGERGIHVLAARTDSGTHAQVTWSGR